VKGRFIFISRPIELRISDVPLQQKMVKEKKEGKWGGSSTTEKGKGEERREMGRNTW